MKEINVSGKKRTDLGKKASKQLRKEGFIPCNLYGEKKDGNGAPEAFAFQVSFSELRKIIYTPHIYVIKLDIEGDIHTAVLKEIQFHPVTDAPLHVDFYEINEQKPITIGIPVKLVGLAQGVRDGGRMNLSIRKINVTAPYMQIPEHLDVDVTALKIGKSIKVGDLSFEGIDIATSKEVIVCSIKMTRQASMAAASADNAASDADA
ncbi:ribosomal protein L25, Ctc-form [Prevotella sp. DNF00663]|uniref:50S ribosomal protein L25/general stress protein Ctc n=1 Tax=unclassified Prevotella TaxID=2638335 RepID=UPI0005132128|nr:MULTISPECIES: 50S ribosomal protein L25/general stress protein Ctc [unclassified Prevotella]KGI60729.1 50S ribosomal protein L25 [Prevotella sp. S7 MS 2]KXB78624.1 ribosomal protein L25, Ctc-form [Prevotella sp. DNF00663]